MVEKHTEGELPAVEWYSQETLNHTAEAAETIREATADFDPKKVVIDNYWNLIRAFQTYQDYGPNYPNYLYFNETDFKPFLPIDAHTIFGPTSDDVSEKETVLGSTAESRRYGAEYRIPLDKPETPIVHRAQLGIVFSVAKEDFEPPPNVLTLNSHSRYVDPDSIKFEGMFLHDIHDAYRHEGIRKRVPLSASPQQQATFLAGVEPDPDFIREQMALLHTGHERETDITDAFAKIVELADGRATKEEIEALRSLMSNFAQLVRPKPHDSSEVLNQCEGTTGAFQAWAKQFGVELDQLYYWWTGWAGHTLSVWKDDIAIDWTGAQITSEGTHPLVYRLGDDRYLYHGKSTDSVSFKGKRYDREEFLEAFNHGQPIEDSA